MLIWSYFHWKFKEESCRPSILQMFLLFQKNDPQTFTCCDCKKRLQCVIVTTSFDKCFLFHVVTGRHCFLSKFIDTLSSLQSPCSCALWNKWFEKSLFCFFYLHNNNSTRLLNKTLLGGSRLPSGQNQYPKAVINIGLVRLYTQQWPKVGYGAA